MERKNLLFILCFQLSKFVLGKEAVNHSIGLYQKRSVIKTELKDLFQYQQTTLSGQYKKIQEYQQQLQNISESQTSLMDEIGSMELTCSKLDGLMECQRLFDECKESHYTLIDNIAKLETESLIQKEMIHNLTVFLEHELNENKKNRDNHTHDPPSQYQQLLLDKIEAMEVAMSKQQGQLERLEKYEVHWNRSIPDCYFKTGYIYKPEFKICYKIYQPPQEVSPETLKTYCITDGAEVIRVNSQGLQDYLTEELKTLNESAQYILIQGNDEALDGTWVYDDGVSLNYFNWNSGQPDGFRKQNVIGMSRRYNYKWHDIEVDVERPFGVICQIIVS